MSPKEKKEIKKILFKGNVILIILLLIMAIAVIIEFIFK
jgi:hypothetical protein